MTIGIPTCNRVRLLENALASALDQSYPNVEIVVSDNASNDGTSNLLADYGDKITVISQQENIGMTRNWDACLSASSGEYFLLLSDDDYLEPDAVQRLVDGYGDRDEPIAFVYGRTVVHKANGDRVDHPVTPPVLENSIDFILENYRNRRFASLGAVLLRTSEMRALGGYRNDRFDLVSDCAMMFGICLLNPVRKVRFVDAPVFNYRVHGSNLTTSEKLDRWVDEIGRLSRVVLAKLALVCPGMYEDLVVWRDRYVVTFVFALAFESRHLGLGGRCRTLFDSVLACRNYIGFNTLKLLVSCVLQLMTPRLYRLYLRLG